MRQQVSISTAAAEEIVRPLDREKPYQRSPCSASPWAICTTAAGVPATLVQEYVTTLVPSAVERKEEVEVLIVRSWHDDGVASSGKLAPPWPDAPYWAGRRWLAVADALVWPSLWGWVSCRFPRPWACQDRRVWREHAYARTTPSGVPTFGRAVRLRPLAAFVGARMVSRAAPSLPHAARFSSSYS